MSSAALVGEAFPPSSSWGSPHPRKNPKTKLPGVVHLLVPCPLSLLLFSKHPRVRGTVNMNWRSGVTKVTLQTYIVNKQIVARNIYYSLYRAVSSRISQTRVCGKNNFLLFPIKIPPTLNETLGVQFTPKISTYNRIAQALQAKLCTFSFKDMM